MKFVAPRHTVSKSLWIPEVHSEANIPSFLGKEIFVGCADGSLLRYVLRNDGPSTVSVQCVQRIN